MVDQPDLLPQPGHGLTAEHLDLIEVNSRHTLAESTRQTYGKLWKYFCNWCQSKGTCPLPADPMVVQAYLTERAQEVSMTMVLTATAAIREEHLSRNLPSPLQDPGVRRTIRNLRIRYPVFADQVTGITREEFSLIAAAAYDRRPHENAIQAQRRASTDIALIGVMRDAMLRRSEAAAARWMDMAVESNGTARLKIFRSKTDRIGKSTVLFISEASRNSLETMLHYRHGNKPLPEDRIFQLGDRQISNRIKDAAAIASLSGRYRGHSPRIGMAMDLAMDDVELAGIMQSGRWERPETLVRYIRSIAAGKGAVARWYERHDRTLTIETL